MDQLSFGWGRWLVWGRSYVVPQAVAREIKIVDRIYHVLGIEPRILVTRIQVVDPKFDSLGNAGWKVRPFPILKGKKLPTILWIGLGVVVLDEASGPADQIEAHEFTPIIGIFALFKTGE